VSFDRESDAAVVRRLRDRPEAAGELYDRYAVRLVGYLGSLGVGREVAMDAAHETFARMLVHRRRIRVADDGTVWPWLVVTGRNVVRDWQRRGIVDARARRRLGIPLAPAGDPADEVPARLDARGRRDELVDAMAGLPCAQRDAILAHVVDGRTYSEIARTGGVSEPTIRMRVWRGLRSIKDSIGGDRRDL
jgi:RNA polymerase sigma factor (sigma-70 family)